MKKTTYSLIAVLVSLGLMAFIFVNRVDSAKNEAPDVNALAGGIFAKFVKPELEFSYDVDSRYAATISKKKLHQATSVIDIVPEKAEWSKVTFLTMKVVVMTDDGEISAKGENEMLNNDQISLLQSTDYSSHFYINARGKHKGAGPEGLRDYPHEEYDLAYYITVIPEKEAEYLAGEDALIDYLKESSKAQIANLEDDKLRPGKVKFTITAEGSISDVELLSTSGFTSVDDHMKELIKSMPGKWDPAENAKGENVEQEFVFSYGLIGC